MLRNSLRRAGRDTSLMKGGENFVPSSKEFNPSFRILSSMKTTVISYLTETFWGYLGVQGDFMEPSRRELKIPLRVLCLLSYKKRK